MYNCLNEDSILLLFCNNYLYILESVIFEYNIRKSFWSFTLNINIFKQRPLYNSYNFGKSKLNSPNLPMLSTANISLHIVLKFNSSTKPKCFTTYNFKSVCISILHVPSRPGRLLTTILSPKHCRVPVMLNSVIV